MESTVDETDDSRLKAEIESIMERVERIMETIDSLDPKPEQESPRTEDSPINE